MLDLARSNRVVKCQVAVFKMSSGSLPKTPRKVYKSVGKKDLTSKSIGNISHWKNLHGKGNCALLAAVENICRSPLTHSESLPHPLCRPCERRLKNFILKTTTIQSKNSFLADKRVKRCIDISLAVSRILECKGVRTK